MDRRTCTTHMAYRPVCISVAFMLGMLLAGLICHTHSTSQLFLTTVPATVMFHFAMVRNFNFKQLVNKFTMKGS